jgi:hypothetical protein
MRRPAEVCNPLKAPHPGLPDLEYPFHDRDVLVIACGHICMYRKKINTPPSWLDSGSASRTSTREFGSSAIYDLG